MPSVELGKAVSTERFGAHPIVFHKRLSFNSACRPPQRPGVHAVYAVHAVHPIERFLSSQGPLASGPIGPIAGSLGTFAMQIAKNAGAEVTGVCSASSFELVKSIGANQLIDYAEEDFTRAGNIYDVVFDASAKFSRSQCRNSLSRNGTWLSVKSPTSEKTEYLVSLRELIEAGKIGPVVDRCYPLEKTAEAHRYVGDGHKLGNVVITVVHDKSPSGKEGRKRK